MSATSDANLILGPLEVGVFVAILLFGAATIQACIYYQQFPDDKLMLKVMVGSVWLLVLGHIISASNVIYTMTVTNYGHPSSLSQFPLSNYVTYILTSLVVIIVQNFYAFRIQMLTRKPYIPVLCWAWSAAELAMTIYAAELGLHPTNIGQLGSANKKYFMMAGGTMTAVMDIVIAATLYWYFVSQKSSAMQRTAKILDRLIAWTIQTGVLTSLAAVACVMTFLIMKDTYVWTGIWVIVPGLTANSCFALLNFRVSMRNVMEGAVIQLNAVEVVESKIPTQNLQFVGPSNSESQNTESE